MKNAAKSPGTHASKITVGRLVRVLKKLDDIWEGGARFLLTSRGRVIFEAWDSERECQVTKTFDDVRTAVEFYEKVAASD